MEWSTNWDQPALNGRYLVYNTMHKRVDMAYYERGLGWYSDADLRDLSHWMPLPDPPREHTPVDKAIERGKSEGLFSEA